MLNGMTRPTGASPAGRNWPLPALIALAALLAVLLTIDPCGAYPGLPEGPGLTADEVFNVQQGLSLADRLLACDLAGFRTTDARLPDHPPLGRVWLGIWHELAFIAVPPANAATGYSIACARFGSAIAYALTVFLIGICGTRWYGRAAGIAAALSMILIPRLFGHAHLAALESSIDLAYAAVVLYLADRSVANISNRNPDQSGMMRIAAVAGLLFGLALLTKIQAVFLPIPISIWMLCIWRRRAVVPLTLFGLVGLLVLLAGWPWLWSAPWDRTLHYFGRAADRAPIYAWYFGRAIADKDLPWHYPWLMFAATVPLGLHLLGGVGLYSMRPGNVRAAEPIDSTGAPPGPPTARDVLLVLCGAFPLVMFSLPGVAVYDGIRLFSVVYPLWCLVIGRGAGVLFASLQRRLTSSRSGWVLAGILSAQAAGLFTTAPCWLSHYNLLVGGLAGADRLGLPVTYWGDSITLELLKSTAAHVPHGATLCSAPTLHAFQWPEVLQQTPELQQRDLKLVPYDERAPASDYLLIFRRQEYLPDDLRGDWSDWETLSSIRRDGVMLAALLKRRSPQPGL
jgi:hypothetical protein